MKTFEAHTDYIRYLEVHPTLPYVISSSDDMQVCDVFVYGITQGKTNYGAL